MLFKLVTAAFIMLGAVILAFSVHRTRQILKLQHNCRYSKDWRSLAMLQLFFIIGYVVTVVLILADHSSIMMWITGVIFLVGAFFVYLVVRTGYLTINDLAETTVTKEHLERVVQQRTEELERVNARLAKLDETKDDFIAVIAHEISTPMTIVKGYTQILTRQPPTTVDDEVRNLFHGILVGVDRLHDIVNTILDVTRIESEDLHINKTPTSIAEIVRCSQAELDSALVERKLTLTTKGMSNLPVVHADASLLCKMFYHIIVNAIKYTPDGGRITVEGSQPMTDEQPSIMVTVSDTGIGIDPQHHELIFEKFYQTGAVMLHSSGITKFKGGGPGLGLAIVKGVVNAHGGQVWVESDGHDEQLCPGSRFFVQLPVYKHDESPQADDLLLSTTPAFKIHVP